MNTQRPEWNDANNALVGYGVSMVTLCHLERYLETLAGLLGPLAGRRTPVSAEVATWLEDTLAALEAHRPLLGREVVDDAARGRLMEALGTAAGAYRATVYEQGFSGRVPVPVDRLLALAALAGAFLRHTISRARREDGLFHAYNVLVPRGPGQGFGLQHLEEMLEGQVAALTTRAVDDEAACGVLEALRRSRLYRADQQSYLLYPDRRLPGFLEKNVIPESALRSAPLLARLLAAGDGQVVLRDAAGRLRFQADLTNADGLRRRAPRPAGQGRAPRPRRGRGGGRAGGLRGGLQPPGLHRPQRLHVRLRGAGEHLLAHGGQAAAGRAGAPPRGGRARRAGRRCWPGWPPTTRPSGPAWAAPRSRRPTGAPSRSTPTPTRRPTAAPASRA